MNWLIDQEAIIRLGCFTAVLFGMFAWEAVLPRRELTPGHKKRQVTNLLLVFINTSLVRLLPGFAAVAVALQAEQQATGVLYLLHLPFWLEAIVAFVLLDLAIYGQHVAFHKAPWLWRLHRVHHTDHAFDVTTGVRFHPLEILLSMLIKMAVVILLGAPPGVVIAFEIILNATSLFNHGNVRISLPLERIIRTLIVTPDMHRVHHSVNRPETDSNFGFNFSCWDRLFGTYRAEPLGGHEAMQIGLQEFRGTDTANIFSLLRQPFKAINTISVKPE